jgi:hypothetical protein
MSRSGVGAVLLLLLAACDSPTAPSRPTIELDSGIVFGIPTLPTAVRVEDGAVIVTGVLQTPSTGYTLLGSVTLTGASTVVLEIHAYDNAPGVPFQSQNYYRATVRNLAPGDYDLSVIHVHHAPSPGFSRLTYRDNVSVR